MIGIRCKGVWLLTLLGLLAGCSSGVRDGGGAVLDGEVTYRERIVLPLGVEVRVRLEDVSVADAPAVLIAEQLIAPKRQVPIPFSLIYNPAAILPGHRYAVRAEIRSADDALLWTTTEHYGVLGDGQPSGDISLVLQRVTEQPSADAGRSFLYECDGLDVVLYTEQRGARLRLSDRELRLRSVPGASGAHYEGDGIQFWTKGSEALLEQSGQQRRNCTENPTRKPWAEAALRGVDFRAVGNEPPWSLEIDDGHRIQLVTDYGERTIETPAPAPQFQGGIVHYEVHGEARDLKIEIEPAACRDSMSGEPFEAQVRIALGDTRYRGCGRYLETTR